MFLPVHDVTNSELQINKSITFFKTNFPIF